MLKNLKKGDKLIKEGFELYVTTKTNRGEQSKNRSIYSKTYYK